MHLFQAPGRARRRHLLSTALAVALGLAGLAPAAAQDYPNKPIRLVIPFPAGGSSDGIGRQVAEKLAQVLKTSVVVENKGGAGGIIGADAVAKSAPDGYTLVLVDVFHSSAPIYSRKMPYDAVKDFTPVALIGRSPAFLVAGPGFEHKTAKDAIAWARANPGKLTMAIAGTGSVVVDLFKARTGISFVSVPYKGSSPALVDLMSGQVQVMITTMASAGTNVKAGKLRALAVTGAKRFADLPDVPTFDELGVKVTTSSGWHPRPGRHAQAGGRQLATAMDQVMRMPEVRERLPAWLNVAAPGPDEIAPARKRRCPLAELAQTSTSSWTEPDARPGACA
jgi:tripartite-type tricarboxylate transporter receptor subunit TctC